MAEEIQVQELTRLGLNAYEAKAYLALLGKDSFTAPQVATRSGVPRQRIYDVLQSLVERGLAVSRPGRQGTKYGAIAPSIALTGLLATAQQRVAELERSTTSLITTLTAEFQAGKAAASPLDYIEILRGATAITDRFAEIQANCKREILVFTKPPYAQPVGENVAGLETLQRNVRACSLYEYSALSNADTRAGIASFTAQGEQARFVDYLPLKLVIVDEEIVLVAMEDPVAGRTDMTIMVIEQQHLAQVMKLAFNALWDRGESFESAVARNGMAPVHLSD